MSHLLLFYGEECEGCAEVRADVAMLREEGIEIKELEVWHNKENMKMVEELDKEKCDGVPFFINTENSETICGAAPIETIRAWAKNNLK